MKRRGRRELLHSRSGEALTEAAQPAQAGRSAPLPRVEKGRERGSQPRTSFPGTLFVLLPEVSTGDPGFGGRVPELGHVLTGGFEPWHGGGLSRSPDPTPPSGHSGRARPAHMPRKTRVLGRRAVHRESGCPAHASSRRGPCTCSRLSLVLTVMWAGGTRPSSPPPPPPGSPDA